MMVQHAAKVQSKDNPKSLSVVKKNAISPKDSDHQLNAHIDMMPHVSASSYPDVPLSPENIIFLQQTAGNQAVDQWIQTKLHDEETETPPKQGVVKESNSTQSHEGGIEVVSDKITNELQGGAKSTIDTDIQSEKSVVGDLATDTTAAVFDKQEGLQDKNISENKGITADDSKQLGPLAGDSASGEASDKDAPVDGETLSPPDKQGSPAVNDDAKAAPSSQGPSNRIDSDKSPIEGNIAEQSLEVAATEAGGIGGGGRMTEMVDASKDGGVELMQAKTEQEKGAVSGQLMAGSQSAVKKSKAKIKQLSTNEKKKESPEKKLGDSRAAVLENKEDKQAEAQTQKAGSMDEIAAPQIEASNSKETLRNQLSAALPTDLKGATEFKKRGKGAEVGAMVSQVIKGETEVVEKNYQQIETLPPAAEPKAAIPMPDIEAPVESGALSLSTGIVPEVVQTQTDLSEFKNESDKLLEREGITEEQLAMVDSGDLAEAKKQRGEVDSKVKTAPSEAKTFEKKQRKQLDSDLANEENQSKKAMRNKRVGMLTEAKKRQLKTTSDLQAKKDKVTRDIQAKYQAAEEKVKTKLATLESKSLSAFDALQKQATQEFENNVESRLNSFKDQRYGGSWGGAKWLKDEILGMDDLPEVKRIFDEEKGNFISKMDQAIAQLIDASKAVIQECRDIISQTRKDIDIYVNGLGPALKSTGEKAQGDIKNKLDKLDKDVTEAANALEQKLIAKRAAAIKAIEEKIENMKAEMSGLLAQIGSFLLDAMLKFFKWALGKFGYSPDQIMGILNKGKSVITAVVTDPVKFIKNMIGAVKGGINNFKNNIKKHLIGGLISWLTGAMGDLPIQIPSEFSLKGILSIVMQILGLTWDRIRLKLVKRVGEPIVKVAESGVDIVQRLISGGPMALWEMVKEKAAEIKQTVMDSIRNWVIVQLVKQAIIKLLSFLNPAGAIVQAILAIYNTIMFFVENIQRIIEMVKSIFNSIGAIAAGQVSAAAAFVERSMAMAIPVILAFLARLMNISGIGKAIRKIMKKIRKPIDKVVNKALDFIAKKARKLFGAKIRKKDKHYKNESNKLKDTEVGKTENFKTEGKDHKLWIKIIGNRAEVMIASRPQSIKTKLVNWNKKLSDLPLEKQKIAKSILSKAKFQYEHLLNSAIKADKEIREAVKKRTVTEIKQARKADNIVEKQEGRLKLNLIKLFEVFGDDLGLIEKFKKELKLVDPNAKLVIYETIEKNSIELKGFENKSFIDLTKKLSVISKTKVLHEKPMDRKQAFGVGIFKDQAMPALDQALNVKDKQESVLKMSKENYIENRKGSIHTQNDLNDPRGAVKLVKPKLQDQIYNKQNKEKATQLIQKYFESTLERKSLHNKFKPFYIKEKLVEGGKEITYSYAEGEQSFVVTTNDKDFPISVKSYRLGLHELGRGITQDSEGKVKNSGLDSAHLIANMFGGSGYKSSKNIVATSSEYNQKIMADTEREIADWIIDNSNTTHFNMNVELEYLGENDTIELKEIIQAIKDQTKDDDERRTLIKDKNGLQILQERIIRTLSKTSQPRVKSVQYAVALFQNNTPLVARKFEIDQKDFLFGTK